MKVENKFVQDGSKAAKAEATVTTLNDKNSNVATCPKCGKEFSGMNSWYFFHVQNHFQLKFKCPDEECGWMFSTLFGLKDHYFAEHGKDLGRYEIPTKKLKCSICSRTLKNQKYYDEHMQNHDKMKYKCTVQDCGWMFVDFENMQQHFLNIHNVKVSKRNEGDYMLSQYLTRGQIKLTDSQGCYDKCSICGRKLMKHMCAYHVKHHKQMAQMYKCPEVNCGWMYENYDTLKTHCFKKHAIKITNENTLYLSATQRSNSAMVECRKCGRMLRKAHLAGHIKDHSKLKYKCSKCGWMFEFDYALRMHFVKEHKGQSQQVHATKPKCMTGRPCKINVKGQTRAIWSRLPIDSMKHRKKVVSRTRRQKQMGKTSVAGTKLIEDRSLIIHTVDGFECSNCTRHFDSETECKKHIERHSHMRYRCVRESCGWMFEQFYKLQWHYSTHHVQESISCGPSERILGGSRTLGTIVSNNARVPNDLESEASVPTIGIEEQLSAIKQEVTDVRRDPADLNTNSKTCKQVKVENIAEPYCVGGVNSYCTDVEIKTLGMKDELPQNSEIKRKRTVDWDAEQSMRNNDQHEAKRIKTDPDQLCPVCHKSVSAVDNLQQQNDENKLDVSKSEDTFGGNVNNATKDKNRDFTEIGDAGNDCAAIGEQSSNVYCITPIVIMPRADYEASDPGGNNASCQPTGQNTVKSCPEAYNERSLQNVNADNSQPGTYMY